MSLYPLFDILWQAGRWIFLYCDWPTLNPHIDLLFYTERINEMNLIYLI